MAIQQLAVARDREAFLDGQAPRSIRSEIAVSWRRCHHLEVPADTLAPRYAPSFDPDGPLLRAARPVLDRVNERLGDLGISFLLTDASARILDRRCSNDGLLDRLDAVSAAEGFVFAEDEVGTNGVGTALELGRMVRVDGHEHYAGSLHQFTCVGVPIRGVNERLHGLLDVTCAADHHNTLVEYVAEQTAEQIEHRLREQQSAAERALLDRYVAASRRGRTDFFLISERLMITSPRAAQLLDGTEQALVWEHVTRLLRAAEEGTAQVQLADGRVVLLHGEAMRDGGDRIGAMVEVRPARGDAETAGHGAGPRSLPGLVGADPAWLRACHDAVAGVRDHPVLICGEAGVGKAALAEATHAARGRLVVHDAVSMSVDGPAAWLDRLRGDVGGAHGTVVVRHVDALAPAPLRAVTAELDAARARGWRCVATAGLPAPALPGAGGRQWRVVTLPPLRNRTDDIPALARSFAAPRRLAPDLVSLLLRTSWPGNTGALRHAVDRARAGARGAEIQVTDLPQDVRAAVFRRRMSRFEQAEMAAILDAMSEAGGNKKAAATLLGISRSTLYRKLEAAGLELDWAGVDADSQRAGRRPPAGPHR